MRCTETELLLGHYLRDELDLPRRHTVEKHLRGCPACQCALDVERELDLALSDPDLHILAKRLVAADLVPLPEPAPLPADFTAQVLGRLLAELGPPAATEPDSVFRRGLVRLRQWHHERAWGVNVATAAAAAVAIIWVGAPLWEGTFDAVMQSPVGEVLAPVVEKAHRLQAAAAATLADLKVLGVQLQIALHQIL
jgi:anti-sigma factor RsiW